MKRIIIPLAICFMLIACVGKAQKKVWHKPHLIVGSWQIIKENENSITLTNPKSYIYQLNFGADELLSSFYFTDEKGNYEEQGLHLAYKIFEAVEGYKKPVLCFINTCDEDFLLAFTIEKLTRDGGTLETRGMLELKCIEEITSKDILLNKKTLKFEIISKPPKKIRQRF